MENLIREATKYTMQIDFNAESGVFNLFGNSYPEDAISFFDPINLWINNYIAEIKGKIELNIKLNYVNSSSSKCFIDLFEILEDYHAQSGNVKVNWLYEEYDDEILESGEELLEDMEFPYEFIPY